MGVIELVMYFIYIVGMVGLVFILCWLHFKLEVWRVKSRLLNDLIDKGYETDKIDLNEFINNKIKS